MRKYRMKNKKDNKANYMPQVNKKMSTFDLSETVKTTMKFDNLYPIYWKELRPGDHFEIGVQSVTRLAPLVTPIMDNVQQKYFAFWVPSRLLWKNMLKFMGEKLYQDDTTEYEVPQISIKSAENKVEGLGDYLGIPPTGTTVNETVSALPFRAYKKIWNDWFRANQLQDPVTENTEDTGDTLEEYKILKKGKPLDYFTGCLPSPQAGGPVTIGLTGNAPVLTTSKPTKIGARHDRNTGTKQFGEIRFSDSSNGLYFPNRQNLVDGLNTNLYADMSEITGVTIEALRKATAIQQLLEIDERSGERYPDLVKSHFGVTVPDFLLGRSQFLGSYTNDININPITQNSSTDATSPQGHLTGLGIGVTNGKIGEVSAVEDGILMVMCSTTAEIGYQQGLHRDWSKKNRFDYMFPSFWNLGEQAVLNKEIYLGTDKVENNEPFGYQERYMEMRQGINRVCGKMRSGVPGTLDIWQLAEEFAETPKLNDEFIESNTPIERILAVANEPELIMDIRLDVKATRCLPVEPNPSILSGKL